MLVFHQYALGLIPGLGVIYGPSLPTTNTAAIAKVVERLNNLSTEGNGNKQAVMNFRKQTGKT